MFLVLVERPAFAENLSKSLNLSGPVSTKSGVLQIWSPEGATLITLPLKQELSPRPDLFVKNFQDPLERYQSQSPTKWKLSP